MGFVFKVKVSSIFRDHINTDDIIPGWTLQESTDRSFFGEHAFSNYDPEFVNRCRLYGENIVVAGENFGSGSSREQAVYALQENNVIAVFANSFSDIFYRNALNCGLVLIRFKNTHIFNLGDEVALNLGESYIHHKDSKHQFKIDTKDKEIFSAGGKVNLVKSHLVNLLGDGFKRGSHFTEYLHIGDENKHQTIVEKILSAHVHRNVYSGERLDNIPIDVLFVSDVFGPAVIKEYNKTFNDIYNKHSISPAVFDKKSVFFIVDHDSPPSSVKSADGIETMKTFANAHGFKIYKSGDGIEHVVMLEDGNILPGNFILGTDSHTCTGGALNALSFGVGTTEASYALATGHLHDFIVPETIRINLSGTLNRGAYAKDLILYIIGIIGVHGAGKKIIEFGGPALKSLSIDSRTTIANMVVEMGARSAIFEYDKELEKYVSNISIFPYKGILPDLKATYCNVLNIDLSKIEPCIAFPNKPDNVTFISRIDEYILESQRVDDAKFPAIYNTSITNGFLGACTNGKYDDFVESAKIIKGRKVFKDIDFVVIPASRKIFKRLLKEGILEIFAEAGANIESSTCGPCYGRHKGLLRSGGQMISSSNRNFMGRMGSKDGRIFLASPATVTASVIEGKITDPRKYL